MPSSVPSLAQETMSAVRGGVALVMGNRNAAGFFDLSLRGLAGAGAAFLLVIGISHYLPLFLGAPLPGRVGLSALMICGLMAAQVAGGLVLLRAVRRSDAYVPFVTTTLWMTLFASFAFFFAAMTGLPVPMLAIAFCVLLMVIYVNIGRLVLTLPPMQVAGLVVAQVVGSFIGLTIIGLFLPLPQDLSI